MCITPTSERITPTRNNTPPQNGRTTIAEKLGPFRTEGPK
jgi:hypothetical protein